MNLTLKGVLKTVMPWCSVWLLASAMAQTPTQPEPAAAIQATGSVSSTQGDPARPGKVAGAQVPAGAAGATPAAPANPVNGENRIPVGAPGSLEARVAACTMCHGATGVQGADAFYPRISGKPAHYLYQQLLRFREGRREYLPMQRLLVNLSDEYLHEIAVWFSKQTPEYETVTPPRASPLILQQGEKLVRHGAVDRDIPACVACHGDNLKGMLPGIPGLTGLTNEYITAQMGAWQYGIRHSVDPDCMGDIARKMTSAEVQAVSAWLASQDPRSPGTINESAETPVTCGIQTVSGVQQ
ncbi:c-type cytochrome [Advenella mimigardefordensis]|uniref:Putative cytochrome c, class 1 n=1 Tax=Advenella mimigardefordensis (strain DSM 17166 / LMG 22922 / DPN7) TaxID=1247726 RepID=W0P8C2_ADVMD|nr:c-type cytochrome [Advenella mimigardefordensis]AHG62986.1 putative cytochrome c, class 1 [Advenella mimigardefordensis DPN7]